ncbi:RNA methyltransferase [Cellulomonas sp. APG4]|nr:RNA methyltransferase [Cellulomonas sp. APG4]NCT89937.1 RNA methyltransferase [Cellulomonas sp. APG4]
MLSTRSDRVRWVRALAGAAARRRHGRFLVEGPQAVREAVRDRTARPLDLYVGPVAADRYPELLAEAVGAAGVHVHRGTADVLEAMSADAQQLVGVAPLRRHDWSEVIAEKPGLVAVLAHARDPGNAGTVIRAADAAGARAAVLTDASVDVHNPKVVRSTAGSLFHLPVVTGLPLARAVTDLRAAGLLVLAADGTGAHDLDDLLDVAGAAPQGVPDLSRPTAWVFGNEAWGLSAEDRALADDVVRVPIHGRAESLNLATAATVCLYASARAQRAR